MALDLKNIKIKIDINNLPKPVRIAIVAVPPILILGLVGFMMILPKIKVMRTLNDEVTKLNATIAEKKSIADNLEIVKKQYEILKLKLKELKDLLPEEKEVSSFLKQLTDYGNAEGLLIQSWKPGKKKNHPNGIVYEMPVDVSFTGTYHNLGGFFSKLTDINRIVNIQDIKLGGSQNIADDQVVLNISFKLVTFVAVEGGFTE